MGLFRKPFNQGKKSGESIGNSVIMRELYKFKEKRDKIGHSRDQHYYFVHQMLRDVFFRMPVEIITILKDKRRNDHLLRLWNMAGEYVGQSSSVAADGLCCKIRKLDSMVVAIITLPAPEVCPEAYFVALVYRPSSSKQKALTRFITLEDSLNLGGHSHASNLCEWESKGSHSKVDSGCEPTLEAFFEAVCNLLQLGD